MSQKSNPYIRGKPLELLKQIIKDGYILTGQNRTNLRFLQSIFPQIIRVQYGNKSIFFLEDKNKKALEVILKQQKSKIIGYKTLSQICKTFNVNLDIKDKKKYVRLNKDKPCPIVHLKEGGYSSSYHQSQKRLFQFDDLY